MKFIYLDQNHMSNLVKEKSIGKRFINWLERSGNKLIISPLHVFETSRWKSNKHNLRGELMEFIDHLNFIKLEHPLPIMQTEILNEVNRILNRSINKKFRIYGHWSGIEKEIPISFSRAVSYIALNSNIEQAYKQITQGNIKYTMNAITLRKTSSFSTISMRKLVKMELGYVLEDICKNLMSKGIMRKITQDNFRKVIKDFSLTNCPTLSVYIWLFTLKFRNLGIKPKENDIIDMWFVPSATQYSDIFVVERYLYSLLNDLKRQKGFSGYRAEVLKSISELFDL